MDDFDSVSSRVSGWRPKPNEVAGKYVFDAMVHQSTRAQGQLFEMAPKQVNYWKTPSLPYAFTHLATCGFNHVFDSCFLDNTSRDSSILLRVQIKQLKTKRNLSSASGLTCVSLCILIFLQVPYRKIQRCLVCSSFRQILTPQLLMPFCSPIRNRDGQVHTSCYCFIVWF